MRRALLALTLAGAGAAACGGHPDPAGAAGEPSPLQYAALRPDQAAIVGLPDIYTTDSLFGRPVRVLGWCAAAPGLLAGRRSGVWILATPDTSIEVRGLVPPACLPRLARQTLVLVFVQVVPAMPDSSERLLLRLPE